MHGRSVSCCLPKLHISPQSGEIKKKICIQAKHGFQLPSEGISDGLPGSSFSSCVRKVRILHGCQNVWPIMLPESQTPANEVLHRRIRNISHKNKSRCANLELDQNTSRRDFLHTNTEADSQSLQLGSARALTSKYLLLGKSSASMLTSQLTQNRSNKVMASFLQL
jgi:hypothetical protein